MLADRIYKAPKSTLSLAYKRKLILTKNTFVFIYINVYIHTEQEQNHKNPCIHVHTHFGPYTRASAHTTNIRVCKHIIYVEIY